MRKTAFGGLCILGIFEIISGVAAATIRAEVNAIKLEGGKK
jgi:hypothetical protein